MVAPFSEHCHILFDPELLPVVRPFYQIYAYACRHSAVANQKNNFFFEQSW